MFLIGGGNIVTIKDNKIVIILDCDTTIDSAYIQDTHYGLEKKDYLAGVDFTVTLDDTGMFYFSFQNGDNIEYEIKGTTVYYKKVV